MDLETILNMQQLFNSYIHRSAECSMLHTPRWYHAR